jgi:hypothetical protein
LASSPPYDRGHDGLALSSALQPRLQPIETAIEKATLKLKAVLRAKTEGTVEGLWKTGGQIVTLFDPHECPNAFKSNGYDPE